MDTRSSSTVELANLTKCNQACNLNDILKRVFNESSQRGFFFFLMSLRGVFNES